MSTVLEFGILDPVQDPMIPSNPKYISAIITMSLPKSSKIITCGGLCSCEFASPCVRHVQLKGLVTSAALRYELINVLVRFLEANDSLVLSMANWVKQLTDQVYGL